MKKNEQLFGNIRALEAMKKELIQNLKVKNATFKNHNTNPSTTRSEKCVMHS